jgi:uncharacterized protein
MTENLTHLFADIRDFDWNSTKREINFRNHQIDFVDLKGIFERYTFVRRSDRHGETRYQIFGYLEDIEIAVACAIRGDICWLISARRARKDEREQFYDPL